MSRIRSVLVGVCKECSFDVLRCASDKPNQDFEFYCEQTDCKNHKGDHANSGDVFPTWIDLDDYRDYV